MKSINGRLRRYGERIYEINHPRPFCRLGEISNNYVEETFEFAYEMAFGEGEHRANRSGGRKKRKAGEIFINAFQGKVAEFAVYEFFMEHNIEMPKPDMKIEGKGRWDSFDLELGKLHIAVKSTKFYGQLLLLETEDWNGKGEYIPNLESGIANYDMYILVRISPDGEGKMKKRGLLYNDEIDKRVLEDIILSNRWEYDIAGFILNLDFLRIMEKSYIIPQGALLNRKTIMDAENYYVQAGDMRTAKELISRLSVYKKRIEI